MEFSHFPAREESFYSFATFALLRKMIIALPRQVPTVTVHWPHSQRSKVLRSKQP